jgi:NAD(P)-dependent dehydrogenase (short-subunit alcohol dehydrogenase family)
MRLDDKVAVITGGGSGIGLAIATSYIDHGARVAIFGRNPDPLDAAAHDLGDSAIAVAGDVTDHRDLDRLFETTAEQLGNVDLLVANAGAINFTLLGQTTEVDFDSASDLNFKAVFFTVQAALPYLNAGRQ